MRTLLVVLSAGAALLAGVPPGAAARDQSPAFRLHDAEIIESSALVISRSNPHLAYTVNDSGDSARVFAVDTRSGRTVGITRLAGVEHVDFEALASASRGRLLVGDIGDNEAERDSVQIHMIDEPAREDATARPRTLTLAYADGPRDAEALLVRDGRIFVVSKRPLGGEVWRGPTVREFPASATLRAVTGSPGTVTDATVLGDGRVVLRNYTAAFVMTRDWQIAKTLMLPSTELGESAAAPRRGAWFYAGTEGTDSPVYRIDVPAPDDTAARAESPPTRASPEDSVGGDSGVAGRLLPGAGIALLVLGATALFIRRRA